MKRMKILALVTVLASLVALCVVAGYEHQSGGKTVYTTHPTTASAWLRSPKPDGTLWPARKIQVFEDTIRHYDYTAVGTSSNHLVSLGYWEMDSTGTLFPHHDLTGGTASDNIKMLGDWTDVEWYMDTDGTLWPKL